ncbi:MAG: MotA/TolQ/ExbB proton channel family protein [Parvibaculaceae bacterium]|nr:MotA/TolQ/ExbB proton channel family protein [Parvibaculaceae bacterium]HBM87583.1 MotA/TolQ/ExbB proton channel family protein [Rhodobiaceae bacterium]|tara:strand:- start:1919 stop:2566 length:648 start_codon:yes stop_codon:yes gene_type:complete
MEETVLSSERPETSIVDPETIDLLSTALNFVDAGGPVLYLLAALSFLTLVLIVAKAMQFSSARLGERAQKGALARVRKATQDAVDVLKEEAQIEKAGLRAARRELRPLEGGLGMLGLIAMLSPLIGLLGTVVGMIDAFRALSEAGGAVDPSLLSAGIWVALLTTAAGLIVAIPAALAHGWFEGRLALFADLAEQTIGEVADVRRDHPHHFGVAAD